MATSKYASYSKTTLRSETYNQEGKELWGTKQMEQVQASKPLQSLVPWEADRFTSENTIQMKNQLFLPRVFKPSYLINCEQDSRMNFKFAADSCSSWIKLSEENTKAVYVKSPEGILKGEHPKEASLRALECVLGDKEIESGRYYWEVVVDDQAEWAVGLAYKSVERNFLLGDTNKSWVLRKMPSGGIEARHMGRTEGSTKWNPHIIGVSFNYDKGILGIYDAESHRQLFYFMSSFCEPCVPAFSLGVNCTLELITPRTDKARKWDYLSETVHSYNIDKNYEKWERTWHPERSEEFMYDPDRWQLPLRGRNKDRKFTIERHNIIHNQ